MKAPFHLIIQLQVPTRRILNISLGLFFLFSFLFSVSVRAEHPFLITKKSEYANLQAEASKKPWSDFIAQAKIDANKTYVSTDPIRRRGETMRDIAGSCALLYIIDPSHKSTYKSKFIATVDKWPALLSEIKSKYPTAGNKWDYVVPPSSGYFNCVLALDVIHDDLSSTDLARIEKNLDAVAEWFWTGPGWDPAPRGACALWAVYQNDTARISNAMSLYHESIMELLTKDGVGAMGPGYAQARFTGERTAKFGFMHVAEYTKRNPVYYSDPKLQHFYEWLFSAGYTPFNSNVTFGDSGFTDGVGSTTPNTMFYAAGRFSAKAAEAAAKRLSVNGGNPSTTATRNPGDLLTYCIVKSPLPSPQSISSHVWNDGMASFWEDNGSTDALMGALWNSSNAGNHRHYDANAIFLAGYGENLLMNSGYAGYGSSACGFSYDYISTQAVANNVLMVGGKNHAANYGDGIKESIVSPDFDFASGFVDAALSGAAKHTRNFIFVHPQDGKNGYFLVLDEADTGGTANTVNLAFHPASSSVTTVTANQEYRCNVKRRKSTDTFLTVFLAQQPASVALKDSVLASWGKSFVGKYIYETYNTVSNKRNLITVLFPHDGTHAKANMSRISTSTHTGAKIDHGNGILDYALESSGSVKASQDSMSYTGLGCVYRVNNGKPAFYFVRQGKSFSTGGTSPAGFVANTPLSVYMKGTKGRIILNSGSSITLFYPGIKSVKVDGTDVITTSSTTGSKAFYVPAGSHSVDLTVGTVSSNVAPSVTLNLPITTSAILSPANITLSVTASDSDGSVSKVEFYNGTQLIHTELSSPYNFTWTNVGVGSYTLTAKAYDNQGATTTSSPLNLTVKAATNQSPAVKITSPVSGASVVAPGSITVSASASDSDGSIAKVEFYSGTKLINTQLSSPYTFTWSNVAAGSYSLTAKAYDNQGATTTSPAVSLTVKAANQPPTVEITAPLSGASTTAPGSFNITANASDSDGSISKIEFYDGSQLIHTELASPYAFTWSNVAAGTHSLTAKAFDNQGATTTSSTVSLTVKVPNQAPTVKITSPAPQYSTGAPANLTVSASASDVDGSIAKVEFYAGTKLIKTEYVNPYTFTWTNVIAGSYSLTAKAYDNEGATTSSQAVVVNIFDKLASSKVTASDYQVGNTPENTIDGNLNTRWSAAGNGAWIQYDQGMDRVIRELQMAWYRGNLRTATFDVQVSKDALTWATVVAGATTSGTTLGYQAVPMNNVSTRYVRIVCHGNSENDWDSICDVQIVGY